VDATLLRHRRLHPVRAVPLDEDSGLTPHFDGTGQAREELPRDWGWHLTARTGLADDDELLCPACAAAGDRGQPRPSAACPGNDPARTASGQRPGAVPRGQETASDPDRELPVNARVVPAACDPPREGG
jgi:hypothetical protein